MPVLTVAGSISDSNFQEARLIAEDIVTLDNQLQFRIVGLVPSEWSAHLDNLRKHPTLISSAFDHPVDKPFITHNNDGYIGSTSDLIAWSKRKYGMADPRSDKKTYTTLRHRFKTLAEEELTAYMQTHKDKHTYVYFDFKLGEETERVVIELHRHACPLAVENVRQLCTGEAGQNADGVVLNYQGTLIHRVIPDAFVQFGDISTGRGDVNTTVSGQLLHDESFIYKHDGPGVVALANMGSRHTNGSQLYITLCEFPALDDERQVIGRVISGLELIQRISEVDTRNQRPSAPLTIAACGDYTALLEEQVAIDGPDATPKPEITSDAGTVRTVKGAARRAARSGARVDLVVVGLDGAGKTSIVNVLRKDYDPYVMPTNGFEVDEIVHGGNDVRMLGLGGNPKIRGIWTHYYADAHAIIYVIDAQARSRLTDAISELKQLMVHPQAVDKPVLVLLNKYDCAYNPRTDMSEYIEVYEVESLLALDASVSHQVSIRTVSTKPYTSDGALHPQDLTEITKAITWVCDEVTAAYATLSARVTRDLERRDAEHKKKMEEKKKAKIEMEQKEMDKET